jgi:hypothetical protein
MKKSTATQIASFALYVSSIALAVGIGMGQVGKTQNASSLNEGGILESCTWAGYGGGYWCIYEYQELGFPCDSGTYDVAKASTFPSYYRNPIVMPTTRRGNCEGKSGCETPKTRRLTNAGCSE